METREFSLEVDGLQEWAAMASQLHNGAFSDPCGVVATGPLLSPHRSAGLGDAEPRLRMISSGPARCRPGAVPAGQHPPQPGVRA